MYELLIKSLSAHVTLTPGEADIISSLFVSRRYRKRQFILQEGDITRYETFIVKGITRTYELDEKGQEHVVQFGPEGWWAGDLYSFLSNMPSLYNIDCLEDTEVLQITRENHELLYNLVPKMERHFRILIQNAFIASTRRVASSLAKSATERYELFKATYPQIELRVPNHQVASYLGITPQSLSRMRAKTAAAS